MQTNFGPKQLIIAFLVVLACYLGIFYWIEHRRVAKGPWMLEFNVETNGTPVVTIHQPALQIQAIQLKFPGESLDSTNSWPAEVRFDQPGRPTPFGQVIYEDLTFLPGVITFNLFGHEIEMLPRALIINKKDVPWASSPIITMNSDAKPETPPRPPEGGTRDVRSQSR